ncbi:hypothetical protein [Paraflavitalea pollutisoli]|uniref:hypothetical protein n=1 Tax=Paraflavitalea pollutisoli TaxID=3034143 RepID=UPI0023EAAB79|nr:hypothetical protein [Paraflavitalea sp. H1-2-19X]
MPTRNTMLGAKGLILSLLFTCCGKNPGEPPGSKPVTDRYTVLLKAINVRQTASPFYHFTYDDSGYVTRISYNEDLHVYHYYYKGGRIDSVTSSSTDARYFLYRYSRQQVSEVLQYDDTGLRLKVLVRYDAKGRVSRMDWQPTGSGPDEKHSVFTYYDNGNLQRVENTYPATAQVTVVDFEAYDNGKAVDDFGICKGFLEHLVLLPGVRFYHNNPTRVKETNGVDVRMITLQYQYQGSLPVEKRSATQVTGGPATGDHYTGLTSYTYY